MRLPFSKKKEEPKKLGPVGWAYSNLYDAGDFQPYKEDMLFNNKGYQVYKEMMYDDQVKAVVRFKQYSIIGRDWYFDVDQDNPDHKLMSDFFTAMLGAVSGSFKDKLIMVLSSLINGYSIVEKLYYDFIYEGKPYWGIKDFRKLPFQTFNFEVDAHGTKKKLLQMQSMNEVEIPLNKIIHHVHQPDVDHLYGESDLRAAHRAYWSKDITIKFRNIHLERHATGFIWAVVKGQMGTEDRNKLEAFLNNLSSRSSIYVPEGVELNKMDAVRTDAYEKALVQDDKAIAKSILVPNLLGLSEQGSTGSFAQSKTQFQAFLGILNFEATRLEEVLNEQCFSELALWNFGTDDFPRFRFEPMTDEMKMEIAKQWNELVGKSVTKSENDEAFVRNLMGFPEKSEEEEVLPEETPQENLDWLLDQPQEDMQFIKKEFSDKPWVRRVNFARIEKTLNTTDKMYGQEVADLLADARVKIEKQIAKVAGERSMGNVDIKEISVLSFPKGVETKVKKTIRENLKNSLEKHYSFAKRELPKRKFKRVIGQGMDKFQTEKFLSSVAMRIGANLSQKVLSTVMTVLENAIRFDKTLTRTVGELLQSDLINYLPDYEYYTRGGEKYIRAVNVPARVENIVRTSNSDAMNQARMALFGDPDLKDFIQAYEYSAIMDDRTTDICAQLHGRILKDFSSYVPPNHYQCRSILIPVTIADGWNGKESRQPSIKPQRGFY